MAEVTYYYNAQTSCYWTDCPYLVDNDLETFGSCTTDGNDFVAEDNTCPGTDLGTITKVEARIYGKGDGDDRIDIVPRYQLGKFGDERQLTMPATAGWSAYADITSDPNAPSPWGWSDVQDLALICEYDKVGKGNSMQCAKVEIRVTYIPTSDIDVGLIPIDRGIFQPDGYTCVDKNNPANASGTIHSVLVWAAYSLTGLRVGTFYTTNGNTLKCRDSVLIGDVTAGSMQGFSELSITVEAGDYIGCYYPAGSIECDLSGFAGVWIVEGEYIDPNDETEYSLGAGYAISLYGYGDLAVAVAAPRHGVISFQDPAIV